MTDGVWRTEYEVGHPRIDFEHRIFFDLIAQFSRDVRGGAPHKKLTRLCAEIYKYAVFHFFSEESMLEDVGYADLADHRLLHEDLLARLRAFIDSVATDDYASGEMDTFLTDWFITHTTREDPKHIGQLPPVTPYSRDAS